MPAKLSPEERAERWRITKERIHAEAIKTCGESNARAFMEYFSAKYDRFQRNLLDWRLCMLLFEDFHYCHRVGTRWYACVGTGGTGKSTLMQNVFYFLDDTFKIDQANMTMPEFISKLAELLSNSKKKVKYKALFMDEPDDDIHPQTDLGKRFRKVLGKARQAKFFFGICATDMTDIPLYIFRKIDTIFFLPKLGQGMVIRNMGKNDFVLQYVRKEYQNRGYRVFFDVKKEFNPLEIWTGDALPFSREEIQRYRDNKWRDFAKDVSKLDVSIKGKDEVTQVQKEKETKLSADFNHILFRMRNEKKLSWAQIHEYFPSFSQTALRARLSTFESLLAARRAAAHATNTVEPEKGKKSQTNTEIMDEINNFNQKGKIPEAKDNV